MKKLLAWMTSLRPPRIAGLLACSILAICSLSGCLKGQVHEAVAYNAKDDTFRYLHLYTNIEGNDPSERKHLVRLWKERNRLMVFPNGNLLRIFSDYPSALRLEPNRFQAISLGRPAAEKLEVKTSDLDLSAIKITPGEFFLSEGNSLCGYQQVKAPGELVDALIAVVGKAYSQGIAAGVNSELARRKIDPRPGNWNEFRGLLLRAIENEPTAEETKKLKEQEPEVASDPRANYPQSCLEGASLMRMIEFAAGDERCIDRKGSVFRLTLPLTADDCQQLKAILDSIKAPLRKKLAKELQGNSGLRDAFDSVKAEVIDGPRIRFSVDVGGYLLLSTAELLSTKSDQSLLPDRETVSYLEKQGVPIRKDLTTEQVLERFSKPQE